MERREAPLLLVCVLVLAVIGLHRFAYYGGKNVLPMSLLSEESEGGMGLERETALERYDFVSWTTSLAPAVGGLLTLLVGLRIALVGGGLVLGLGLVLLAQQSVTEPAILVFSLGHGLLMPSIYVAAAQVFPRADRTRRTGLFFLLYAAVNVGALQSGPAAGLFSRPSLSFLVFAILCVPLLILAAAVAFTLPRRNTSPEGTLSQRLGGLAPMVLAETAFWFAFIVSVGAVGARVAAWSEAGHDMEWYQKVPSGLTVLGALTLGASCFLWATRRRRGLPATPILVGAGLAAAALGFFVQTTLVGSSPPILVISFSMLLLVVGELALVPLIAAAASVAAPARSALIVGIYLTVSSGGPFTKAAEALGEQGLLSLILPALVLIGLVTFVLVFREFITRALCEAEESTGESAGA